MQSEAISGVAIVRIPGMLCKRYLDISDIQKVVLHQLHEREYETNELVFFDIVAATKLNITVNYFVKRKLAGRHLMENRWGDHFS